MGLFSRGEKVRGTVQVVATTRPPESATSGNCRLHVVIQAPGLPATSAEVTRIIRVKKWPHPGQVLPCEVDPRKPDGFKILWDEVEAWSEQARRQADALAQQMNQGGPPGAAGPLGDLGTPGSVQVVNLSGGAVDPAKIAKLEQMLGIDLDGDGAVGGGAQTPASGNAPDQRVAALERLAALHEKGLLTDAEFTSEKRRLLGSS